MEDFFQVKFRSFFSGGAPMSEKFNINIADVAITVITDEDENTVNETVALLDSKIREMNLGSARTSKLEAALVTALDCLCEKNKLKKRVLTAESHSAFYAAQANALRAENEELKKKLEEYES